MSTSYISAIDLFIIWSEQIERITPTARPVETFIDPLPISQPTWRFKRELCNAWRFILEVRIWSRRYNQLCWLWFQTKPPNHWCQVLFFSEMKLHNVLYSNYCRSIADLLTKSYRSNILWTVWLLVYRSKSYHRTTCTGSCHHSAWIPCHRVGVSASTLVGAGGISAAPAAVLDVGKVKVAKTTHCPQLTALVSSHRSHGVIGETALFGATWCHA